MKFFKEIKNRFILIVFSWIFTIFVCYIYKKNILFLIFYSNQTIFMNNCFYFITTNITDIILIYFNISYFITNQTTIIYSLYNFTVFMSPALYKTEYKRIKLTLQLLSYTMLLNFLIINKSVVSLFWNFLNDFQEKNTNIPVYFEAKITEYIDFYFSLYYLSGAVIITYFTLYYIINYYSHTIKTLKKIKKLTLLLSFLAATLLTPPDVTSQIILGLFLFVLNEIIIVTFIIKKNHNKRWCL